MVPTLPTRPRPALWRACGSLGGEARRAVRGPLPHAPGTAANDMVDAIARHQNRAVGRRSIVIVLIAILDPLPNIAIHVMQTERIGRKRSDRRGFLSLFIRPIAAATAAICISVSD